MLFATLPSGRRLSYAKPRIGTNRFGNEGIIFEGVGASRKWMEIETFSGKLAENVTQAVARDILSHAISTLRHTGIVMHIHDELVIEADPHMSTEVLCQQMSRTPPWAEGLLLRADGFDCPYYQKD